MTITPPSRLALLAILAALLLGNPASAQQTSRTVGRVTITIGEHSAFPGGMLDVRLTSRRGLGIVYGILDGRRCPAFATGRGLRALVPIPVTYPAGKATLGVEIRTYRGRQRIPMAVTIRPRRFSPRSVVLPEAKRGLLAEPGAIRDGRLLLLNLRTVTPAQEWRGPFQPPVEAQAVDSFGRPQTYIGGSPVETRTDGIFGEYHRGLDYPVPVGSAVRAPAAGVVLLAGPLALSGQTLVLDHGQGLISVFYHLGRIEVPAGTRVERGALLGQSGDSGIAAEPHLHWGVFLHGVPIDPKVAEALEE